jgi:serine/threonine protein kinase
MAPELLRSEPQSLSINDYRTADVWAVGITTFFMMTKNVPFRSQPAIMNFTGNLDGMIQDNIPARCQISESGRAFIKELLEPQAEKRFDAGSAKLHPWVHHWLPEAPTSGTDSRYSA